MSKQFYSNAFIPLINRDFIYSFSGSEDLPKLSRSLIIIWTFPFMLKCSLAFKLSKRNQRNLYAKETFLRPPSAVLIEENVKECFSETSHIWRLLASCENKRGACVEYGQWNTFIIRVFGLSSTTPTIFWGWFSPKNIPRFALGKN